MNKKIWVMVSLAIVCVAGLIGCNIFSWTHSAGSGEDATVLLADADSALASGDYAKAMEYYQKAIDADPTNSSKARYGYVNAYVKNSGLNIIDLAKNTGNQRTIASAVPGLTSSASAKAYNLIDDTGKPFGLISIKALEDLAIALVDKLEPIAKGATDGKVSPNDPEVNLNLAIGHFLRALLIIADPPDGNSGSVKYNSRHNDNNTYTFIYLDGSEVPIGTPLVGREKALNELSLALTRLTTAIDNSLWKDSQGWLKAKNSILELKYNLEINHNNG